MRNKIYEEHIKGDPQKEELYELQIPFEKKWSDSEFRKQHPRKPRSTTTTVNVPKCPICGSTNLKKLTFTNKAISVGVFGLLSNKINKTYECLDCKATF